MESMSKSRGNVVSPDEYVSKYGPMPSACIWASIFLYRGRLERRRHPCRIQISGTRRAYCRPVLRRADQTTDKMGEAEQKLNFVLHNTIKSVSHDIEIFPSTQLLRALWS